MFTVKLMNDFIHSPIWIYDKDGITDEPSLIADDVVLQNICRKVEDMYASYYEFDSHDMPCWFNYEKEKAEKTVMLDLISQIKARLEKINDGSFVIEDLETEKLVNL